MNLLHGIGQLVGGLLNGVGALLAAIGGGARDLAHLALDEKNRAYVMQKMKELEAVLDSLHAGLALNRAMLGRNGVDVDKVNREILRIRKQITKMQAKYDQYKAFIDALDDILHRLDPHEDKPEA